jgi:hypothetical protein
VNPISPISQISQLLRKNIEQHKNSLKPSKKLSSNNPVLTHKKDLKLSKTLFKEQLLIQLDKLSGEEKINEKGITLLVSNILRWTFGSETYQDPKMQHAINEVTMQVMSHPEIKTDAVQLIKEMYK